jgi:hypothetical protein
MLRASGLGNTFFHPREFPSTRGLEKSNAVILPKEVHGYHVLILLGS